MKEAILNAAPAIPAGYTDYKNFFPPEPPEITTRDTQAGTGTPAACGQDVTIAYTTATSNGKPLPDHTGKDNPLTFRIGEHKVMMALEQGLVGMSKGGKRIITAPPGTAYDSKYLARKNLPNDATILFDVELLAVKPTLPSLKGSSFHISNLQQGTGRPILCGTPAKVQMTVWDMAGKKLFSTLDGDKKPITFTPGQSKVFSGLEQGVIGMRTGGERALVVPPALQKTMRGNAPAITIPFPPKQTVLVEVEAIDK